MKTNNQENKISGITYLILFFGILGWMIDAIIYFKSKNKHMKLHAAQSCFLVLIFTIFGFLLAALSIVFPITLMANVTLDAISVIVTIIYLIFAISVFLNRDIKIPFIVKLVEKK